MWVDEVGLSEAINTALVADTALNRAWAALSAAFTDEDWVPRSRGRFLRRLGAIASRAIVDADQLRLRMGDFY